MTRRWLTAGLGAFLAVATPAVWAQDSSLGGDPQAGRAFALEVCTPCHVVSSRQLAPFRFAIAPRFDAIANSPGMTSMALKAFLATPHKSMPNHILSPDDSADVIAYILSLQKKP